MSKELEALKYLKENKRKHWLDDDKSTECLDAIETTLKEHELMKEIRITARFDLAQVNKEHKALDIIKEKPQTLCLIPTYDNYDTYLELALDIALIEDIYSLEEFDLLKEVLGNE